jgi:hypothetical protein
MLRSPIDASTLCVGGVSRNQGANPDLRIDNYIRLTSDAASPRWLSIYVSIECFNAMRLTCRPRFEHCTRSLANMPSYLKRTGYKHVDAAPGPFQDAHSTWHVPMANQRPSDDEQLQCFHGRFA